MKLSFELFGGNSPQMLHFEAKHLVIAGWTGRDTDVVAHHIEELAALGVPAPSAVPLFYRVATNQLSQSAVVQVVGAETSGEVEPLLFRHAGEFFVSIGSDHTDRALEAHSVALSKQICVKPVARSAWRLAEVQDRWDSLVLRSWIEEHGEWRLYQEGTLAALRSPADLLVRCTAAGVEPAEGFAMTCGTVGAIGGIRTAARFRMELADAHTGRRISHEYQAVALPVVT